MSRLLKKVSWFCLFLLVVLAAVAVAGWGVSRWEWPRWLGWGVVAGIIGSFFFVLFLKKYLIRRRGRKLVEQVVSQDQQLEEDAAPDLLQVKELEKNWNANLSLLRDSHLRSKGNPVYVLPWYLALGVTGTGKTTSISNFALASSVKGTEQGAQTSTTKNCNWWFLDKAIVLDTAGRYAVPVEGTGDQEEWKRFLCLLAKYRKREPLNGILLFIGADAIREAADDLLKKQGQLLRNRIDNLMRTIGYKIPVRVIVSKMDLIPGFIGFADSIAASDHDQVMGYWNRSETPYWQEVLTEAMQETGERLRELRQEYVLSKKKYHPDLLTFPESFELLYSGLSSFLKPIFSENRFQETPYLAGIYFGSGLAPRSSDSSVYSSRKISEEKRSLFLAELFSKILRDGRERLEPVKEFVLWRRMTKSFGLMSWWLFCLFCAGLVGISFLNNQNSLSRAEDIAEETTFPVAKPSEPEEFNTAVLELETFRREIIKLDDLNQSHSLSSIHFRHAVNTERELKARYCKRFESVVQQPLERRLALSIGEVSAGTSNELFADLAAFSVEYITLLQEYLNNSFSRKINPGISPAAARILRFQDGTVSSEVASTFADLVTYYLLWSLDRTNAVSRLKILQSDLVKLLAQRVDNISWLYHPFITETGDVKLSNFWPHKILTRHNGVVFVEGAFTKEGREKICNFLKLSEKAVRPHSLENADEHTLAAKLSGEKTANELQLRFRQVYEINFFSRWYNFAENFSVARKSLDEEEDDGENVWNQTISSDQDGEAEMNLSTNLHSYHEEKWRETAIRMTKESNPYFNLIKTISEEVENFSADEEFLQFEKNEKKIVTPPWAETIIAFNKIQQQAEQIRKTEGKGLSATAAKMSSGLSKIKSRLGLNKAERVADKTGMGKKKADTAGSINELATVWNNYQKSLNALESATPYQEKTFQVVSNWFLEAVNPKDEPSLYGQAYQAVGTLHGLAKGKYDSSFAWRLIEGPFDFLTEFGLRESAAVLQKQWEEQVVAPAGVIDTEKLLGFLFEKESGAVWKFIKDTGEPFLQNTVHGYQSRDVFGRSLLFESPFYTFLDQGTSVVINKQADYRVEISNRPMKVNSDSTEEPYASVITVQCADDEIVLENDNYPRTQNFTWSPDKCGDVNLTIQFPSTTLHKSYKGNMAFAHFLSEFIDGALHFTPADFPEEEGHLRNSNIQVIILKYALNGQEPVLRLLELKPEVPKTIARPEQQHGDVVFN